jgi:quinol monooxygenase YgiN
MAPHITYFKMRVKPGERQKVIDLFDRWLKERRPSVEGFVMAGLSSNTDDPDEFMSYAMFADKATYDANSNSPGQTAWYNELRAHLAGDPEWFDSTLERQRMG